MITETRNPHSPLQEQGAGCRYYSKPVVSDYMQNVIRTYTARDHELICDLVLAGIADVCNPLVFVPGLLHDHPLAAHFKELLARRLKGSTLLPAFVGSAVESNVLGFPK